MRHETEQALLAIGERICPTDYAVRHYRNPSHPKFYGKPEQLLRALRRAVPGRPKKTRGYYGHLIDAVLREDPAYPSIGKYEICEDILADAERLRQDARGRQRHAGAAKKAGSAKARVRQKDEGLAQMQTVEATPPVSWKDLCAVSAECLHKMVTKKLILPEDADLAIAARKTTVSAKGAAAMLKTNTQRIHRLDADGRLRHAFVGWGYPRWLLADVRRASEQWNAWAHEDRRVAGERRRSKARAVGPGKSSVDAVR